MIDVGDDAVDSPTRASALSSAKHAAAGTGMQVRVSGRQAPPSDVKVTAMYEGHSELVATFKAWKPEWLDWKPDHYIVDTGDDAESYRTHALALAAADRVALGQQVMRGGKFVPERAEVYAVDNDHNELIATYEPATREQFARGLSFGYFSRT